MSFGPAFKAIFTFRRIFMFSAPWLILSAYWILMFTLTHLPSGKLPPIKVAGNDKTMHYLAYLGLGLIFWLCYYRNVGPSLKQKRTWLVIATLLGYGIFDEITQSFVGRTTDPADFMFDAFGVITALLLLFLVRRLIHWVFLVWAVFFAMSHWPTPTHFIQLPAYLDPLKTIGYMASYCLLTIMWWRCLSTKNRFMVNKFIFAWTTVIMVSYCFFDQFVLVIMRKGFNSETLTTALLSVMIGLIASFLFGLQNQAEENYQKYIKHIEEQDHNDISSYGAGYDY